MKKIITVLTLSFICLSSASTSTKATLAAGAELPENFKQLKEQEAKSGLNDIIRSYSTYEGSSVTITYTEEKGNGDTYYYRGTLNYVGTGSSETYEYLGDKREFELDKIVTSSGNVIIPQFVQ